MCADGAADFTQHESARESGRDVLPHGRIHLHQRKLQTERDWLGTHTWLRPIIGVILNRARLLCDRCSQRFQIGQEKVARLI